MLPIPAELDALLEDQGCRYGLLIYASGFSRSKKEVIQSVLKDLVIGTATAALGGFAVGSEVLYASDMDAAVLDSETDRIVFYSGSLPGKERHPLKEKGVRSQLASLLKDFVK